MSWLSFMTYAESFLGLMASVIALSITAQLPVRYWVLKFTAGIIGVGLLMTSTASVVGMVYDEPWAMLSDRLGGCITRAGVIMSFGWVAVCYAKNQYACDMYLPRLMELVRAFGHLNNTPATTKGR